MKMLLFYLSTGTLFEIFPNLLCSTLYRAKNGEVLEFDISRSACDQFGFYYSDRVDTPLGTASG